MSKASLSPRAQVVEAIRSWIASGRIAPGTRLPAEQGIADELRVARGTVRSALVELTRLGVLVAVARRGYRAAGADEPGAGAILLVSHLDSAPERDTGIDAGFEIGTFRAARLAGRAVLALGAGRLRDGADAILGRGRPFGAVLDHQTATAPHGPAIVAALRERGIPCVVHGDDGPLTACDRVVSDSAAGAALLVRGLIAAGRRRILPVWSTAERPYWLREREAGIAAAAAEAGIAVPAAVVIPSLQRREIDDPAVLELRMRQYLGFLVEHLARPEPIDAILATSDSDVFPLAMACRRLGREPGRDVLIAGYDNYWRSCWERTAEASEPWATIDRDNEALGEAAIALLVSRVADPTAPPQRRAVPPRLVAA